MRARGDIVVAARNRDGDPRDHVIPNMNFRDGRREYPPLVLSPENRPIEERKECRRHFPNRKLRLGSLAHQHLLRELHLLIERSEPNVSLLLLENAFEECIEDPLTLLAETSDVALEPHNL